MLFQALTITWRCAAILWMFVWIATDWIGHRSFTLLVPPVLLWIAMIGLPQRSIAWSMHRFEEISRHTKWTRTSGGQNAFNANRERTEQTAQSKPRRPVSANEDALEVLGLDTAADLRVIKARYRELAKQFHPDLNRLDPRAEEKLKRVNQGISGAEKGAGVILCAMCHPERSEGSLGDSSLRSE